MNTGNAAVHASDWLSTSSFKARGDTYDNPVPLAEEMIEFLTMPLSATLGFKAEARVEPVSSAEAVKRGEATGETAARWLNIGDRLP